MRPFVFPLAAAAFLAPTVARADDPQGSGVSAAGVVAIGTGIASAGLGIAAATVGSGADECSGFLCFTPRAELAAGAIAFGIATIPLAIVALRRKPAGYRRTVRQSEIVAEAAGPEVIVPSDGRVAEAAAASGTWEPDGIPEGYHVEKRKPLLGLRIAGPIVLGVGATMFIASYARPDAAEAPTLRIAGGATAAVGAGLLAIGLAVPAEKVYVRSSASAPRTMPTVAPIVANHVLGVSAAFVF